MGWTVGVAGQDPDGLTATKTPGPTQRNRQSQSQTIAGHYELLPQGRTFSGNHGVSGSDSIGDPNALDGGAPGICPELT